jgi:hypothetical protein
LDAFHDCTFEGDRNANQFEDEFSKVKKVYSLSSIIIAAPLMGLLLDLWVPLPSSIIHSIVLSILGSALVALIWVSVKYDGPKSVRFYVMNVKNFLFTPNMLKVFSSHDARRSTYSWIGVLALSTAMQILIFTPGNASYLGHQVTKKIDDASGANLEVDCPSTKIHLYNEKIECRVKTGLLGISVPARAQLSPLIGSAEIKVSLF